MKTNKNLRKIKQARDKVKSNAFSLDKSKDKSKLKLSTAFPPAEKKVKGKEKIKVKQKPEVNLFRDAKGKGKGRSVTINISMPATLLKLIDQTRKKVKPEMNRSYLIYTILQQALESEGVDVDAPTKALRLKSLIKAERVKKREAKEKQKATAVNTSAPPAFQTVPEETYEPPPPAPAPEEQETTTEGTSPTV